MVGRDNADLKNQLKGGGREYGEDERKVKGEGEEGTQEGGEETSQKEKKVMPSSEQA